MRNSLSTHFTQSRLIAFLLFWIALAPRLPGLRLFLTSDENTNIFFAGSDVIAAFLRGDFRATYWHFYPGVTMSWLDALGMTGQYLLDWLRGVSLPPFTEYIYGDILSLLVANRLPYAILTAAAVPAVYWLSRQLLPERIALLGALFLAFDPFFLAHSRVAHGDAPVAVFMSLSALTFFIYAAHVSGSAGQRVSKRQNFSSFILAGCSAFGSPSSFFLIPSAIFGGLAALTKAPGQFMAIFIIGLSLLYTGLEWWQAANDRWQIADGRSQIATSRLTPHASRPTPYALRFIIRWLRVIIIWGLISLAVFVLLWPAIWVDPLGTLQRMLSETFGKVEEGHLVYFFGQPTLDPGPWFYLYVIPFRLTPVVLLGVLFSLIFTVYRPAFSRKPSLHVSRLTLILLWLFVISLLLFSILSPKKQDRYLLPLFPFLDLLAAAGWFGLLNLAYTFIKRRFPPHYLLAAVLLLLHMLPVFTYYPYYLTYFNPLMGGPVRAAQTTLMGWGEGMEQVAAYLNGKPDAERLYVASTPSQTLLPYFAGTGENFYTNDVAFRADYVVLYLAQMQRLAPSPEIIHYFQAQQPEKIITIHDVVYAKIYPGPKLILTDIPSTATPANIGLGDILRLAGYKIQNIAVTLYWHALAPLPVNYTISVRARAADGRLLVQQDSQPVDGLLPTTLWRQGDYVADRHMLEISPVDWPQLHHFEVVVYNANTGETLGPPINLPTSK
ncbi:MAG: phospholipid carrier-dependent glycosyltransferase [Anaerolineales bacterium]|nr:phospholipid carrier-dependent glycosyltransferase [Anaerolineales bacterium]